MTPVKKIKKGADKCLLPPEHRDSKRYLMMMNIPSLTSVNVLVVMLVILIV